MALLLSASGVTAEEPASCFWVAMGRGSVRFDYWVPSARADDERVLLLVPGHNGSGPAMLTAGWRRFAEANGLVLLAPSFEVSDEALLRGEGYYYPSQGSGAATEAALEILRERTGVATDQILVFGFSGGAHFAHRFALWKPGRVRAFVAAAAAWWSKPDARLKNVPALILCGEGDPRFDASLGFYQAGATLGLPWVWRSYEGVGHEISPMMLATARAFLAGYVHSEKAPSPCYGDIQTYAVSACAEDVPEAARVRLPSRAFAEVWRRER